MYLCKSTVSKAKQDRAQFFAVNSGGGLNDFKNIGSLSKTTVNFVFHKELQYFF